MSASSVFLQTRAEVEATLARKAPSALTVRPRVDRERMASGVEVLDRVLEGGLPVGAISEFVGITGSGRTTAAVAFAAAMTRESRSAAWIDVADAFDPASAALNGVQLAGMLWVRCLNAGGTAQTPVETATPHVLHHAPSEQPVSGGSWLHPRSESRGMPEAIRSLLEAHGGLHDRQLARERKKIGTPGMPNRPLRPVLDREEQASTDRQPARRDILAMEGAPAPALRTVAFPPPRPTPRLRRSRDIHSWPPLDHALRATDLLLQAGGFGLIVFDLGDTPAERSWRIPLATWFRYRAACERSRTSLLLLTQHPCARSSAELVVRMDAAVPEAEGSVLAGLRFRAEIERQRFHQASPEHASNVVAFRKPPQRATPAEPAGTWRGRSPWAV